MRICFFGNIETPHLIKWAKYFSSVGHEVHVISFSGYADCAAGTGIRVHIVLARGPLQLFFRLPAIRALVRKISPDIIHGHYIGMYGLAAALCGASPLVLTAWGSDILISTKNPLKRLLVKFSLGRACLVTCDAEHMRSAMSGLGVPLRKVKLVMFGVDTVKFSPGPRNTALLRRLGIPEGAFIVLSLRSFDPVYDIPTLIRAAASINAKINNLKVVLVGGGPQESELRALVRELGMERAVIFAGKVPYSEIPELVRLADVYVSTSLSDGGLAASTAEAMACGVPVVISDNLDNKLWVQDRTNGRLFLPGDHNSLAGKVLDFAANPTEARACALAGRRVISERNDYFREMGKMEAEYLALTIRRGG